MQTNKNPKQTTTTRCLGCKLFGTYPNVQVGQHDDVYVCLCYNVPTGSSRQAIIERNMFDLLIDEIIDIRNINDDSNIFIVGDMNARVGTKSDFIADDYMHNKNLPDDYTADKPLQRHTQDIVTNDHGNDLLNFCKQAGVRIMNGRVCEDERKGAFTCVKNAGCSLVDYVLCKPELMRCFTRFVVQEPNVMSDHCAISFSIGCNTANMNLENVQKKCNYSRNEYKYVWDENRATTYTHALNLDDNIEKLHELKTNMERSTSENDIESNIDEFYSYMCNIVDPMFKKQKRPKCEGSTHFLNKWFDASCRYKRKIFYKNLNVYTKDKSDNNRQNMTAARSEYKSHIRRKRYMYNKNETLKLEKMRTNNAKEYWRLLKNAGKTGTNINLNTDDFYTYFKAINNPNSHFFQSDEDTEIFNETCINNELQIMFSELDTAITHSEIYKACNELRNNRAEGPDHLINEFFKYGVNELINYLHVLLNKVFEMEYFPQKWSDSFLIPLHKKGSLNNVENYRGISLLSHLGKLFTRILSNRLNVWAENYNVYVEAQAGFRKRMSTVDDIFVLNAVISHMLNSNKKVYVALVDFRKAFDYVVRDILWCKLIKYGIRGKILNIIKHMYSSLKTTVRVNGEL